MIPASTPDRRRTDARMLVIDPRGVITHRARAHWTDLLRADDVVVANDAATLPASLTGIHHRTGTSIELRLAGRASLAPNDVQRFSAVMFGPGDYRVRTEDRPVPPRVQIGDELTVAGLRARIERVLDHPRFVSTSFEHPVEEIWRALALHARPIQYSYVQQPLQLWDTWTAIAARPVAFEAPSAGFILDWQSIIRMRRRGVEFVTLTHAAGISSTGDPALDRRWPLDEAYSIPSSTAAAIRHALRRRHRIVAIGTSVVRALEHSASKHGCVRAGEDVATGRISAQSSLQVVDVIISGTHEAGESHYELLRAFAEDDTLERAREELDARGYLNHEFGDSMFVEVSAAKRAARAELNCPIAISA